MKIKEHAPYSGCDNGDDEIYELNREIIKIEDAVHYPDGYTYAVVTFEAVSLDNEFCHKYTLNTPFYLIANFDTEFEGETWEAENE
jgi:hypothetical protein